MIVVGHDGSVASELALAFADAEAVRRGGGEVVVVRAWNYPPALLVPAGPRLPVGDADEMADGQARALRHLAAEHPPPAGVSRRLVVGEGSPGRVLLEASEAADLLVVGTRGMGRVAGLILGSASLHAVGHAACPVLVVPPEAVPPEAADRRSRRLMVGHDGSAPADAALRWAVEDAARDGGSVRVITAVEVPYLEGSVFAGPPLDRGRLLQTERDQAAERVREVVADAPRLGVRVTVEAREGHPVEVLAALSGDVDMVVIGRHGRGTLAPSIAGSVSRTLPAQVHTPVVVVPHPG